MSKYKIIRARGGSVRREVPLNEVHIPDLWRLAMWLRAKPAPFGGAEIVADNVLETWHLAHDLLAEVKLLADHLAEPGPDVEQRRRHAGAFDVDDDDAMMSVFESDPDCGVREISSTLRLIDESNSGDWHVWMLRSKRWYHVGSADGVRDNPDDFPALSQFDMLKIIEEEA